MDNNEDVRRAVHEKRCCFGTVDSWLLYVLDTQKDSLGRAEQCFLSICIEFAVGRQESCPRD